ncbi:hypothetical protein, partial [Schlesneria sp.]|uniref:hypothetical protein n=1 Tax=Schlesneria sp. TaxID=2762018 RepID=UPI002F16C1AB
MVTSAGYFSSGYKYRDEGQGRKFEILKQVSNNPSSSTQPLSFAQILQNYKKDDQLRRLEYFRGATVLFERVSSDFVPRPGGPVPPGISAADREALKNLLHSSEAETDAGKKAKSFRWLSDAELMLASDNLLNALDSRFQVKTNQLGKPQPQPAPAPGSPPANEEDRPEPPSAADAFTKAAQEAGFGLSTYWVIRQDVGLLDRDVQPVDGVVPLSLESLYMQLQERRLQSRINGGKVRFNESSRGKHSKEEIQRERDAAEEELQQTGMEAYLSLAILGASHKKSTDFSENGAGELRTKLGVAARVYSMIRSGKQPDGYIESFIPNRNPAELYADAVSVTITAIQKENIARDSRQQQLSALTQISAEIDKQRQSFRSPLEQLSGFRFYADKVEHAGKPLEFQPGPPPVPLNPSLPEHQEAFFRIVDERVETELKRHAEEVSRRTRSVSESIHRETDLSQTRRELANQQAATGSKDLPIQSFGALGASAISIQQATTAVYQSYQALQHALDAINDEKNYVLELDGINQQALQSSRKVLTDWAEEQKNLAAEQVFLSSTNVS